MGLCASVLLFNGNRVRCSTSLPPQFVSGGTPMTSLGLLSLALSAPVNAQGGLGFAANGAIAADIGGVVATVSNGLPFTSAGRLACDQVGAIASYSGGLPFTAAGALAIAAPE